MNLAPIADISHQYSFFTHINISSQKGSINLWFMPKIRIIAEAVLSREYSVSGYVPSPSLISLKNFFLSTS
jgi:hypothetical protein